MFVTEAIILLRTGALQNKGRKCMRDGRARKNERENQREGENQRESGWESQGGQERGEKE